jgi:small subunit ribosomal protein S17
MAEENSSRGSRKQRKGIVVSKSGAKTIVVETERRFRHPVYGKEMKRRRRFHAHDENNEAAEGDLVRIVECRPMSRLKCWRMVELLKKGERAPAE